MLYDLKMADLLADQVVTFKAQVSNYQAIDTLRIAEIDTLKAEIKARGKTAELEKRDWIVRCVTIGALSAVLGAGLGAVVVAVVKN